MSPGATSENHSKVTETAKKSEKDDSHVHGAQSLTPLQAIAHGDFTLPGIPTFPSFAEKRQWQLNHMAAAFRYFSRRSYVEGMSGHISVRDPEYVDAFWMNPLGVHFGLLRLLT